MIDAVAQSAQPRIDLVLCMAGIYRRFREAGYATPKFLLPWRGRTVLDHILAKLLSGGAFNRVILVANRRDQDHHEAVAACLAGVGCPIGGLTWVGDTRGQAETASLGLDHRDRLGGHDGPVAFHNIDTILQGRDWGQVARRLAEDEGGLDGWIDVFPARSPAFSYVDLGADGLVREIAEKRVISSHATTGFYAFASGRIYREAAAKAQVAGSEFYISDVYRAMLMAGQRIGAGNGGGSASTLILGTPAEYETALAAHGGGGSTTGSP